MLKYLGPLAAWSVFVWGTRLRNIFTDDELSTSGQLGRGAIAVVFLLGAAGLVWLLVRRRRGLDGRQRSMVVVFALFTIAYWIVRDLQILVADHSVGFKVVHTVLAVVSIAASVLALRFVQPRSRATVASATQ